MAKTRPSRPSRRHLQGNRVTPVTDRRLFGAVGGRKSQAMGKYKRFSGEYAREMGRKGGAVKPARSDPDKD